MKISEAHFWSLSNKFSTGLTTLAADNLTEFYVVNAQSFVTVICGVLLLHQPGPSQSSHYADNPSALSKHIRTRQCQDLCLDMNVNLRKRNPTLIMLLQEAMPLKFKVYGRRSNPVHQGYRSDLDDTDEFLCDCDTRTNSIAMAAKLWMDNKFLMKPAPLWTRYGSKGLKSNTTNNQAVNPFIYPIHNYHK